MVSFVSLQSVLAVVGLLVLLNLIGLGLVLRHRRRIDDTEAAIVEQLQTVAGALESGLAEDVGRIEDSVTSLTDTATDVDEGVSTLENRLPEVERTLARLDGRLDGFSEGGLVAIEDRLEAIQDTLGTIEEHMAAVDTSVDEAGHTVADLEDAFASLQTEVDRVVKATTDGNAGPAVAQDLADVKRRLTAIEGILTDQVRSGVGAEPEMDSGPTEGGADDMSEWISGTDAEPTDRDVTADTAAEEDMWADSPEVEGPADDTGADPPESDAGEEHGFDLPGNDYPEKDRDDDGDGTESEDGARR
ncbi:MAG: hypothetical protein R3324_04750 [Halobacteriales archaeon]|nr:hypothetical protein [Halobacteriales archaeon]